MHKRGRFGAYGTRFSWVSLLQRLQHLQRFAFPRSEQGPTWLHGACAQPRTGRLWLAALQVLRVLQKG
jgi:hypothetical protein